MAGNCLLVPNAFLLAQKLGIDVNVIASSEDKNYNYIPKIDATKIRPDADYLHITSNNTIYGTKLMDLPKTNIPIIADMLYKEFIMAIKVDAEKCVGCGSCVGTCPVEVLEMQDDGKVHYKGDGCIDCGACVSSCPVEALSL